MGASTEKISTAGYFGRNPLSEMKPGSVPGPTCSPNSATFDSPCEPSIALCTSTGLADRDVCGSRSFRTTTYEMPCRARVSARPADGRPAAKSRCTESSARIVSGGVSGIESRTPHGLLPSTCSGSSWLDPHTCVANGAPGATSTLPGGEPELCSSSQAAVSCQYRGIASNAPGGVSRPVHASDVPVATATSTTIPTATRLSFSGCAKACTHSRRGADPGSGRPPSRWARPSTNGNRISGSSLCTLRSGVPPASRNV